MKKSMIVPLCAVAGIAVFVVFWFVAQGGEESQSQRTKILIAKLPEAGKQEIKVDNSTKHDSYRREEEEKKEKAKKVEIEMNNIPQAVALNAGMADALKDDNDRKLDKAREFKTVASYGSRSQKEEVLVEEQPTTQAFVKKQVYQSSLRPTDPIKDKPKKDKQKEKKKTEEEDPFNMTTYTQVDKKPGKESQGFGDPATLTEAEVIKAAVYGGQKVKQGGQLKLRLLQEAVIDGISYPRNTIVYGAVSFGQDRLLATVSRLPKQGGGFSKTDLVMHESDLQEGIFAPVNPGKEAGAQQLLTNSSTLLNSVPMGLGSAASNIVRAASSGPIVITVDDGRLVVLIPKPKNQTQNQ